jgi:anti-sigma factor RsiW
MSCPDLRLLSQLLDGELTATEAAAVAPHVEGCATCRTRRIRLERALGALRGAVPAPAPAADAADRPAGCLAPEQVAGWVARALTTRAERAADAHLEGCAHCLAEALAAAHMTASLDALPSLPVPAVLKARVASRWGAAAEPSLTALVLRLTRAGVALVERHVVAPLLDVEERLAPAPAVRAEAAAEALAFLIRAPEAEIHATVVPAGDAVTLTLALERAGVPLAGQRVSLRQHGRAIYSARTDAAGEVHLPRLEPGVYEVSCWSINTAFRLDLLA